MSHWDEIWGEKKEEKKEKKIVPISPPSLPQSIPKRGKPFGKPTVAHSSPYRGNWASSQLPDPLIALQPPKATLTTLNLPNPLMDLPKAKVTENVCPNCGNKIKAIRVKVRGHKVVHSGKGYHWGEACPRCGYILKGDLRKEYPSSPVDIKIQTKINTLIEELASGNLSAERRKVLLKQIANFETMLE